MSLHSPRLLSGIYLSNILHALQGMNVDAPARPRFEDWYRPHLGTFLCVNKDGVLCHVESPWAKHSSTRDQSPVLPIPGKLPEVGGETEDDACTGSGSYVAPLEPLVHNDLMGGIEGAGIFWPNSVQGPNSGQLAGQTLNTTDGLVFS